jgi:hypothetical protein
MYKRGREVKEEEEARVECGERESEITGKGSSIMPRLIAAVQRDLSGSMAVCSFAIEPEIGRLNK